MPTGNGYCLLHDVGGQCDPSGNSDLSSLPCGMYIFPHTHTHTHLALSDMENHKRKSAYVCECKCKLQYKGNLNK